MASKPTEEPGKTLKQAILVKKSLYAVVVNWQAKPPD